MPTKHDIKAATADEAVIAEENNVEEGSEKKEEEGSLDVSSPNGNNNADGKGEDAKDDDDGNEEEEAAAVVNAQKDSKEPQLVNLPPKEDEDGAKKDESRCGCRKSGCNLLYCPCFGAGNKCTESCKCKDCENPKGVHPNLARAKAEAEAKKKIKLLKKELKKAEEASKAPATPGFPQLFHLTVSPGRLGLTITVVKEGGVVISNIDPACTFRSQVEVGDRIVTIDGKYVLTVGDLQKGKEKARKFGIIKLPKLGKLSKIIRPSQPAGVPPLAHGPTVETKPIQLYHGDPRKQTFPYLRQFNAHDPANRASEHIREDLMTELLQWDKRNKVNTQAKMGACRYQLVCIPLRRRETVKGREYDNQAFHAYNKQTKVFDKFIDSWASYCDGTKEDAANMILYHMAKNFPQCYVKNFEMATKKTEKIEGPKPIDLPPGFISYDGSNDVKWNTRYAELVKYYNENGNTKVYSKSDLGRWVCSQRSARNQKQKSMTEKRIELLEKIEMVWNAIPEGWSKPPPGGCPRQNKAIAAKLVYPDLNIRECLYLAGFNEQELSKVKDQKHMWRTGYVYYKDQINKKVDKYEIARKTGARLSQEKLIDILRGDDEDKLEQVFGECSHLLSGFLEAAEERIKNGEVEKPRRRKKRVRNEVNEEEARMMMEDHEEEPPQKMPHLPTHLPVPGHHEPFEAQQAALDLHSWRQQHHAPPDHYGGHQYMG